MTDSEIERLKSEFQGYKEGIELAAKLTANQIKEKDEKIKSLEKTIQRLKKEFGLNGWE
jgi:uncharacterized small protein (DUF1192 family)